MPKCEGAACEARVTTLASGEQQPTGLFVRDGRVYWVSAETHRVRGVASGGGRLVIDVDTTSGSYVPSTVFVDGQHVYWSEVSSSPSLTSETSARIRRVELGGGASSFSSSLTLKGTPQTLPLTGDADLLYTCAKSGGYYSSVARLDIQKPVPPSTSSGTTSSGWFDVQPTRLAVGLSHTFASWDSTVSSRANAANANTVLHDVGGAIGGLVVHGTAAFVTVPTTGAIRRVDPTNASASVITLASDLASPTEIAGDASALFWIGDGHAVMTRPFDGAASPREVIRFEKKIASIAVDDQAVYVTTATEVLRFRK